MVSLCNISCPRIQSVNKAGLELWSNSFCLWSAGIKGVLHHWPGCQILVLPGLVSSALWIYQPLPYVGVSVACALGEGAKRKSPASAHRAPENLPSCLWAVSGFDLAGLTRHCSMQRFPPDFAPGLSTKALLAHPTLFSKLHGLYLSPVLRPTCLIYV